MIFRPYHYEREPALARARPSAQGGKLSPLKLKFIFFNVILPYFLILLGSVTLLVIVIVPLFLFSPTSSLASVSPVAEIALLDKFTGFAPFEFSEFRGDRGFTILPPDFEPVPDEFYLTVPKLGIKRAIIKSNSTDLNPKNFLGHYKGTSLPDRVGNVFIYGHSVLPAFFRPDDYKTIFSTLHTLKKGDRFEIEYNGKNYIYEVEGSIVQRPGEVRVFDSNPKYKLGSYATLFTCSPPGLKTKRLLVIGKLVSDT